MLIETQEAIDLVKELLADSPAYTLQRHQGTGDYNPATLDFTPNADLAPVGVKLALVSSSGSNLTDFDEEKVIETAVETRYALLDWQGDLNLMDEIKGVQSHDWKITGIRRVSPFGPVILYKIRLQR